MSKQRSRPRGLGRGRARPATATGFMATVLALACFATGTNEPELSPAIQADIESDPTPGPSVDPPTDPSAGTVLDPAPVPALDPPTAEEIEQLLVDAAGSLRELNVRRKPVRHLRGPHPEPSGLDEAYAQERAIGYEGSLADVRQWMALAKFGVEHASQATQAGPLVRYDLCVTRKGDDAWLHVVVPAGGLADDKGAHYKAESRERWVLLSDRAAPGVDYTPFKQSAAPSLARQWGKEVVINDLLALATQYRERTGVLLGIGDISHVTGGKIEDHWTHRVGADADVYLLDYAEGDEHPHVVFHQYRGGRSIWSTKPGGKGQREHPTQPGQETPTASRLRALAELVLPDDLIAYFVHNDPLVLAEFDKRAGERKPGRRYLHARNKGYWPTHDDHVHLRWVDGPLPVGVTPKP